MYWIHLGTQYILDTFEETLQTDASDETPHTGYICRSTKEWIHLNIYYILDTCEEKKTTINEPTRSVVRELSTLHYQYCRLSIF
jgi:hypothetical protein